VRRTTVIARRGALAGAGAILVAACGEGEPPILASVFDGAEDAGVSADGPSGTFSGSEASTAPLCIDGSVGGDICGCLELNLLTELPNIYFVLDRSGSMTDSNKWTSVRDVVSGVIAGLGPRAQFGAAVFPDPRTDDCSTGIQVMPMTQGDSPAGTYGAATELFTEATDFIANGGTPTAATLTALLPSLQLLGGKTYVILATDGGPNCDASATCDIADCIANIEGDPGCTPNAAPNCRAGDPQACLDADPTVQSIVAFAAQNIPTYVIGVPGSGPYGALLDRMAEAGGTSRASEPYYYAVDTTDEAALATALNAVAAKITGTCSLQLKTPPPDPGDVNLYLDGVVVPQDATNGWTLSGETITLLGTTCADVLSGNAINIRIVAGCPTVLK